eukprot:GHRR01003244.1.p2 GENE.GHRR01003244.1~~GHRR01003244.1.p2  ORF type:complete len:162 (+),score=7.29 GHRR01003244.1:3437-3922(+)
MSHFLVFACVHQMLISCADGQLADGLLLCSVYALAGCKQGYLRGAHSCAHQLLPCVRAYATLQGHLPHAGRHMDCMFKYVAAPPHCSGAYHVTALVGSVIEHRKASIATWLAASCFKTAAAAIMLRFDCLVFDCFHLCEHHYAACYNVVPLYVIRFHQLRR